MFEFRGVPQKCSFLQSYLYSWFLKSFQFCPILSNLLSFKKIVFKFYRNLASCYNILGNNGNQLMYTSKTALYGDSPKRCGDTYVQLLGVGTMGTFFSQENYGISKPFFTVTNWDIFLVSRKTKTLKKFKVKEKEITNKPTYFYRWRKWFLMKKFPLAEPHDTWSHFQPKNMLWKL